MPTTRPEAEPHPPVPSDTAPPVGADTLPTGDQRFRESFGENLSQVLDVNAWRAGWDLAREYPRIEREVREAVEQESAHQRWAREYLFPKLFDQVTGAGV